VVAVVAKAAAVATAAVIDRITTSLALAGVSQS